MKPDTLPWVESPFYESLASQACRTPEERAEADSFRANGCLILHGVVPADLIDRVKAEAGPLFRPDVPDGPRSAYRVQDGWRKSRAVREVAILPNVLAKFRFL